MQVPVIAFLVEHPSAGPILIDTGFHPSVAVEPKQAMGRFGGLLFKEVRMDAADAVPEQLRRRGVDRRATSKTVVMTHLHSDHASGIAEFPDARFVVSAQEWEAASKRQGDRRLPAAAVRPRLRLPPGGPGRRHGRLVRHLRTLARPVRRRQRAPGLHPRPHPWSLRGRAATGRPRGADLRRRRLHDADDRGKPPAVQDGRRAPLRALAERDPALHRADAGRGGRSRGTTWRRGGGWTRFTSRRSGRSAEPRPTRTPAPRRRGTRPAGRRSRGR